MDAEQQAEPHPREKDKQFERPIIEKSVRGRNVPDNDVDSSHPRD
jgi:hypothetical protein